MYALVYICTYMCVCLYFNVLIYNHRLQTIFSSTSTSIYDRPGTQSVPSGIKCHVGAVAGTNAGLKVKSSEVIVQLS